MIGYTISPLDSNESILEKLNKLEKYLKENPLANTYITTASYVLGDSYIAYSQILNSSIKPLIKSGDILIFANKYIGMVTAVDSEQDYVYYDNSNVIQLPAGPTGATGPSGANVTSALVTNNIDGITATITFTDSQGNTFTTNAFNLVTKDYVDTILGDINTILDNINGEVI